MFPNLILCLSQRHDVPKTSRSQRRSEGAQSVGLGHAGDLILPIRRPGFLRRYNDINGTTSRKQGDKNKLWLLLLHVNSSSGSSSGSSSAIRRSPYREQSRASPGFTRSPRYDTIKSAWFESSYSNASWRPDIIGSDLYTKHDT